MACISQNFRLDMAVTTSMNHLLKAPFSVHPVSGQICIPFHADNSELFNPEDVPSLHEVVGEVGSQIVSLKDAFDISKKKSRLRRRNCNLLTIFMF